MDLEKEVFELYKMLDYWKGEAKSMQETHAEQNQKLRNQLRERTLGSVTQRLFLRALQVNFNQLRHVGLKKPKIVLQAADQYSDSSSGNFHEEDEEVGSEGDVGLPDSPRETLEQHMISNMQGP